MKLERRRPDEKLLVECDKLLRSHGRLAHLGASWLLDSHSWILVSIGVLGFCEGTLELISNLAVQRPHVFFGHHPLSHESTPASQDQLLKINVHHATQFAYYLRKLSGTQDGDGSLLDHLILYYAASMSEGNHSPENLPVVLAGGGAGQLKGGQHLRYPGDTPLANLHLTVMRKLGLQLEKIHDSTGELKELTI